MRAAPAAVAGARRHGAASELCTACAAHGLHARVPRPASTRPPRLPATHGTTHARSWGPYTLDGRSVLAPADGKAPDDPLAWPARSFLDLVAEDAGVARRLDQVPGLAAFRLEARGFFHGALRCGCAVVC